MDGASFLYCKNAWFHFGYPQTMKKMYENDSAELVKLFQMVRDCGTATSLDLTMPDAASEAGKLDWMQSNGLI